MVRDDLYITIPTYFRCPISLDVMKSPVSLCTGVTYDRSSIQRWLDGGNNTCPATMQVLQSKDLVPNHTLQRLIKTWSDSDSRLGPTNNSHPRLTESLTSDQTAEIVRQLEVEIRNSEKSSLFHFSVVTVHLSRLISFAAESEENGRFMSACGGRILPLLVSLIGRTKDLGVLERIVVFCNVLLKYRLKIDSGEQGNVLESRMETGSSDFKFSILTGLKEGRLELRIAIVKFLELMAIHLCLDTHSCSISEEDQIYSELLRLITASNYNPEAMEASLSFLTRLSLLKRNRSRMIRVGGVATLATALVDATEMTAPLTEKLLKLLEMASGSKDGRNEICSNEACVKAIVKKVLKVSSAATEHAVTVLWSLCCLFEEKRAATIVAESNAMAKILVLLQSNCSPAVRQMCGDLLRVFRCSSKASCVTWYDTKTTHIMPF